MDAMPPEPFCRDAVRRRDPAADGRFVYAVRTTGIFCRPSCAARPARPENLSFHPTPEAARAAGFRPCRRCRPEDTTPPAAARWVEDACTRLAAAESPIPLAELARPSGLSPAHFHRLFRRVTGITPGRWATAERARRAGHALTHAPTITQAIYEAGFSGPGRFYETAAPRLGMTPTAWRRGGEGTAIRFALGQTSLGALLVAATDRGVCAIELGDDPETLLRALQDRFPRATLTGADPGFEATVARAAALVEAPGTTPDLPLDLRGTAFQLRVWEALRAIPPGTTTTYTGLAQAIGAPGAQRAVARACATNPLAVAIPCHRVVRLDGDPAGYRWGLARKQALLTREATLRSRA